jgi:primosomal protein N'
MHNKQTNWDTAGRAWIEAIDEEGRKVIIILLRRALVYRLWCCRCYDTVYCRGCPSKSFIECNMTLLIITLPYCTGTRKYLIFTS